MIQINELLELRKKMKERKPDFIRQDYQRRKRLGRKLKWRKPKGIHSKIRHRFKGRRKMPSPGYKSPRKVKDIHASCLRIVNVSSINDVVRIKKEIEGVVISKKIGKRKKLEILKKAKELKVTLLNLNVDESIKKIEDFINSKKKKETREVKETKKDVLKEEKKTKIQEQKEETVLNEEQKKETNASELVRTRSHVDEKIEKDKILIKKV